MVFVLALIVNALAPTFGGTKDQVAALKLVAYGSTAALRRRHLQPAAGAGAARPARLALFDLPDLHRLPVLMRCPPEKAGAYTAVVIVCAIVAGIVHRRACRRCSSPGPMGIRRGIAAGWRPGAGPAATCTIKTPDGTTVTINPGAWPRWPSAWRRPASAMESAQKSGDSAAAGKAVGDMMGADHRQRQRHADRRRRPEGDAARVDRRPEAHRRSRRSGGQAMGIAGSAREGVVRRRRPAASSSRSPTPAASPAWRRWPAGPT